MILDAGLSLDNKPFVQEVHIRTLQVDQTNSIATPTRRRSHTRPTEAVMDVPLEDKMSPEADAKTAEMMFTCESDDHD